MIDVALTPERLRPCELAVVIDVLRATSTATAALAAGYERVLLVAGIERAAQLRAPGRVLAGERRCVMPAGFDRGNSPRALSPPAGRELVLATTNGTPAVVAAAARAPRVILACLLNLDAVADVVAGHLPAGDVHVVCSGTDGAVALEDVYVAGRLCAMLGGPCTDAARVAGAVAAAGRSALDALGASAGAAALRATGLEEDIAACARVSVIDLVPEVVATSTGTATVAARHRSDAAGGAQPVDSRDTVSL